jgi:hypothetical protein
MPSSYTKTVSYETGSWPAFFTVASSTGVKSMDGLVKPERSEGFGADRVLGLEGSPSDVGDEENSH